MPEPESTRYHFAEAAQPTDLDKISEEMFRHGWRKSGKVRQIEIRLPDGRTTLRYSQAYLHTTGGDRVLRCMSVGAPRQSRVFWGEIAPCEHWLQVCPDEEVFLDSLENFVFAGLDGTDAVVVIATPDHLARLNERLRTRGFDAEEVLASDRYICLGAEEALGRFMVKGWPDEALFRRMVHEILGRARQPGRRVRVFGEMVALLWARGDCGATVRLEHLWHVLCQLEDLSLFCAYPRSGFTHERIDSIREICAAHSRLID